MFRQKQMSLGGGYITQDTNTLILVFQTSWSIQYFKQKDAWVRLLKGDPESLYTVYWLIPGKGTESVYIFAPFEILIKGKVAVLLVH